MTDIDINKAIANAAAGEDPERIARELELRGWTRHSAETKARAEGLELTDAHWKVIEFLQSFYLDQGEVQHARHLSEQLDEAFAAEGGARYLYRLFPAGPVAQGARIAGVPVPQGSEHPSFGSTF